MDRASGDPPVRPTTIEELLALVARAARDGSRLHVGGRGRSSSEAGRASPRAQAIGLDQLPIGPSRWAIRGDLGQTEPRIVRELGLVRVAGAARVQDVLEQLERAGRTLLAAVPGAGTIAGAIQTAEQGSGMIAGPLCDSVAAIEMVSIDHGVPRHLRLEPGNGIGEPARDLVQDDPLFRSALVSFGCTGAITAVTLVTVPAFGLEEHRERMAWSSLRGDLVRRARSEDFLELAIAPDGRCIVRVRERIETGAEAASIEETLERGASALDAAADQVIRGPSWQVMRAPIVDRERTLRAEIVVAVEEAVAAIDAALSLVRARGSRDPLVVRFARASSAYLAMQYGRISCAIEIASEDASLLTAFERALIGPRIGGRPAWGKRHTIAGGFLDHYPKAARWLAVHRRLGAGIFESAWSRRMGLPR